MKGNKIIQMQKALDEALKIDEKALSDEIRKIGFRCCKCAKCCRPEHGDNTVVLFPFEIRTIIKGTGRGMNEIVCPTPSEDMDSAGNIHTFEWVIKKKGDCIFLECGFCKIYDCRPFICKTYPFYLLDGELMVSECDGLGEEISYDESIRLAGFLKERHITEIKEMTSLLGKFRGFKPDGKGICVHDSEGEHWVPEE
jgi:Fe-S-cluster containining protein